jgi:multiple sugar transport system substrate-binding protein
MGEQEMKKEKRVIIVSIILVVLIAPLSFAGGKQEAATAGPAKASIELWHGMGASDGELMRELELRFISQNPGIDIKETVIQWTDLYAKLKVASLGKELPDLVIYHDSNVAEYADVTFKPLDGLKGFATAKEGIGKDHQSVMQIKGKTYYMPISVVAQCLLFNKDLTRDAGYDPVANPLSIDQFYECSKKITKDTNGDGKVDIWGAIVPFDYYIVYTGWISSLNCYGGSVLSGDNKQAAFGGEAGVNALKFYVNLFYTHKAAEPMMSWDDAPKVWTSGKAGFFVGISSWKDGLSGGEVFVGEGGKMGLAAWPYPAGKESCAAGIYHGFGLTQVGTQEETNAAWAFTQYVLGKNVNAEWGVRGAQFPTAVGAAETEYFRKNGAYLAPIGKNVKFVSQPSFKTEEIKAIMMKYIEQAILENMTTEDAIKTAATEVNQVVR